MRGALPLSGWWKRLPVAPRHERRRRAAQGAQGRHHRRPREPEREQGRRAVGDELPGALIWFVGVVGRIEWERLPPRRDREDPEKEPPDGLDLRADRRHRHRAARRAAPRRRRGARAVGGQPQPPGAARGLALARHGQGRRRHAAVQPLVPHARVGGARLRHRRHAPRVRPPQGRRAARRGRCAPRGGVARARRPTTSRGLRALLAEEPGETSGAEAVNEINARLLSGRPVDWDVLLPRLRSPTTTNTSRPRTSTAPTSRASSPATGARPTPAAPTTTSRASARTWSSTTCACSTPAAPATSSRSSPRSSTCAGSTPTPRRRSSTASTSRSRSTTRSAPTRAGARRCATSASGCSAAAPSWSPRRATRAAPSTRWRRAPPRATARSRSPTPATPTA